MKRFVISYFSNARGNLSHLVEADSQDAALRIFFDKYVNDYSKDHEGFAYFREDFTDPDRPMGAAVEVEGVFEIA